MAITYVGAMEDATAGSSPKTIAVNIGTRTNGLLVVAVCFYDNGMGTPSLTYAGTAMSLASEYPTTNGTYHVALYYLANPADGNNNLVLTWTGSNLSMYVLASWYDGVAQTSPLDQVVTGTGATDPSLSITPTENNELIVSHYFSAANSELTVGSGETLIAGHDWGGDVTGGSYAIQTTAGAQTVDWAGVDSTWYMVVASFKEAAAGGDQTKTITEAGSGADAIGNVSVSLALAESGSGAETFSGAASLGLGESGSGADLLAVSAAVAVHDAGIGVDAASQISVALTVYDAGAGADIINLLTGGLVNILETGAGVDGISISVAPLSLADSGSGVDSLVIQATVGLADMASGMDAVSLLQSTYKLVSDLATGTDAIGSVSVSLAVPESGAGIDLVSQILAWVILAETGSGVEVAVAFDSVVRIATISFTIARRSTEFTLASRRIDFTLASREIDFSLVSREDNFEFS